MLGCSRLNPMDRNQVLGFLAIKLKLDRKELIRSYQSHMHQHLQSKQQNPAATNKANVATVATSSNNAAKMNTSGLSNTSNQRSPTVTGNATGPSPIIIRMSDLSKEIRERISNMENEFAQSRLRNESSEAFLKSDQGTAVLSNLESTIKMTHGNNQRMHRSVRDFVFSNVAKTLGVSKGLVINQLTQIRNANTNAQINQKIAEFKDLIDKEMPKNLEKYRVLLEEFKKSKSGEVNAPGADLLNDNNSKKKTAPRKRFEWTLQLKDLFHHIVALKFQLYKPAVHPSAPNFNAELDTNSRHEFIKTFLTNSILRLWPDGWMQMHTLFNLSQNKQQQIQIQNNVKNNTSPSPSFNSPMLNSSASLSQLAAANNAAKSNSSTPVSSNQGQSRVINVASKSGKQIKMDYQPLSPAGPTQTPFNTANFGASPASLVKAQQSLPQHARTNIIESNQSGQMANSTNLVGGSGQAPGNRAGARPMTGGGQQVSAGHGQSNKESASSQSTPSNAFSPGKQNVYSSVVNAHAHKQQQHRPPSVTHSANTNMLNNGGRIFPQNSAAAELLAFQHQHQQQPSVSSMSNINTTNHHVLSAAANRQQLPKLTQQQHNPKQYAAAAGPNQMMQSHQALMPVPTSNNYPAKSPSTSN